MDSVYANCLLAKFVICNLKSIFAALQGYLSSWAEHLKFESFKARVPSGSCTAAMLPSPLGSHTPSRPSQNRSRAVISRVDPFLVISLLKMPSKESPKVLSCVPKSNGTVYALQKKCYM